MSDCESEREDLTRRLVAPLHRDLDTPPPGLAARVRARIRLQLLGRDLLDLVAGAPAWAARQLLRRDRPPEPPEGEAPPRETKV